MARPRVFVSSTYYDLRVVRADLERFPKELGFEPILFERGHVPYGNDQALERALQGDDNSDIVVAIVGGTFRYQLMDDKHSISQRELNIAVELGKQIYILVEKSVFSEYGTYERNKM